MLWIDSWALAFDLNVPMHSRLVLRGEGFVGSNLIPLQGGILQGVSVLLMPRFLFFCEGFFSAYSAFFADHLCSKLVELFQRDALRGEDGGDDVTSASGENVAMSPRNFLNEMVRPKHSQQA